MGQTACLRGQTLQRPDTFLANRLIDPVTLKPLRSVSGSGLIFAEVANRFIAEKQRDPAFTLTAQTIRRYEVAFRLFNQWAKQPRLDDVDRRKASDFLDDIASLNPRWGRGAGVKKLSFAEIMERYGSHNPDSQLRPSTATRWPSAWSGNLRRTATAMKERTLGGAKCDLRPSVAAIVSWTSARSHLRKSENSWITRPQLHRLSMCLPRSRGSRFNRCVLRHAP